LEYLNLTTEEVYKNRVYAITLPKMQKLMESNKCKGSSVNVIKEEAMVLKKRIALLGLLLLAACGSQQAEPEPSERDKVQEEGGEKGNPSKEQTEDKSKKQEEAKKTADFKVFFMKDGTEAEFLGEGNEYASYTTKTQWLYGRYVNVYENNGGTVMLRTFRIDEDKVTVIQEEGEAYDTFMPSEKELEQMNPLYTYLQIPLTEGSTFDGWTVISESADIETPLRKFSNVIVVEKKNEGGSIIRKYIAEGYGEIKREYLSKEGDQDSLVTSAIANIK